MPALLSQRAGREWLAILLGLSLLGTAAALQGWFWRADQALADTALASLARPAREDILIIAIDEASLKQIGRWPWRRNIHATLVDRLTAAGAKAVLLDVLLVEPDRDHPEADQLLARSVKKSGRVVLPLAADVIDGVMVGESLPVADLPTSAARLSHAGLELDPDGLLRTVYLRAGAGEARHDTSSLALLRLIDPARWPADRALPGRANLGRESTWRSGWSRDHWYRIPYAGPPGHYATVAYIDVLRGDVPATRIRDKIVMVGVTAAGLADAYPAPVSGGSRAMAGVEVQANLLQALDEGIDLIDVPAWMQALFAIAVLAAAMSAWVRASPRRVLGVTLALALAVGLASALAFRVAGWWWPPFLPVFLLALAYPLWSWRRLEAVQQYLDRELAAMAALPARVPEERLPQPTAAPLGTADQLDTRIAAMREASQRLQTLNRFVVDSLSSMPAAVLVTDATGTVLFGNRQAGPWWPGRRLDGAPVSALLSAFRAEGARDWAAHWREAAESSRTFAIEAVAVEGGHEVLVQFAPLYSNRGPQIGAIVAIVDIAELRESERRRDEALRFLSHDMRAPQASIITLLELHRMNEGAMPAAQLVPRVERYARRTLDMADDFLRLARAERVDPRDFVAVDLKVLLEEAVEDCWSAANARGIALDCEAGDGTAEVTGDPLLLTRALINLLSNAIKYSPPGTTTRARLVPVTGGFRIDIADEGYGIAADDLSRLFQRFGRITREDQPAADGIGLGLVFVKTCIERHGGRVSVTSRVAAAPGDGSGSTFSVELPAAAAG